MFVISVTPETAMGGLLSLALIIVMAVFFFMGKFSGNKRLAEAAKNDDIAGGAAWLVVLVGGIFLFMVLVVPYLAPITKTLEEPWRSAARIFLMLVSVYIPYRVACFIAPAKGP